MVDNLNGHRNQLSSLLLYTSQNDGTDDDGYARWSPIRIPNEANLSELELHNNRSTINQRQ